MVLIVSLELWEGAVMAESGLEIWQVLAGCIPPLGPEREPPLGVYLCLDK